MSSQITPRNLTSDICQGLKQSFWNKKQKEKEQEEENNKKMQEMNPVKKRVKMKEVAGEAKGTTVKRRVKMKEVAGEAKDITVIMMMSENVNVSINHNLK